MANFLDAIDETLTKLLTQWDVYTFIIALALTALVAHTILTAQDPDIHPFILLRQSSASRVRKRGESAIYRASDLPEGVPLRSGLNFRRPTDAPYAAGRDGDVRDIWRRVTGELPPPGAQGSPNQKIMSVFGRDISEHNISELSKEIAVIGNYIVKSGGRRVAVYLPNSVEFLSTIFACSFFGLSVILIPFNQPYAVVVEMLRSTKADSLVAAAGSLPLEYITDGYPSLKHIIWVVEKRSRHMDWTEVPEGLGGSVDVTVWHQLVQDHADSDSISFPDIESSALGEIVTIWQTEPQQAGAVVSFTQSNIISAAAAITFSLPRAERLSPSDLFFPADSLTTSYCLAHTLSALWSGASVAFNSVAGPDVDLAVAASAFAPTAVVASAASASRLHASAAQRAQSGLAALAHRLRLRSLADGLMPPRTGLLARLAGSTTPTPTSNSSSSTADGGGGTAGTLHLLFVAERVGCGTPPLSGADLCDLRAFTGARVVYALTAARVAGAVAQTHAFDYRVTGGKGHSHFGAPLGSVEIKLVDMEEHKTTDDSPRGEIIVSGPAVQGGQTSLGVPGTIRDDFTLAYI